LQSGVFINYRGDDSHSYGVLLYRELTRELGRDQVFLDSVSIPAGTDFTVELLDRVRRSRVLLAVIGPRWMAVRRAGGPTDGQLQINDPNDWIRRELAVAFAAGVTVIPVLTDDAMLPGEADLPADIAGLARRQYRQLRHRDADADLNRIRQDIAKAAPDLLPPADAPAQPPGPVGGSRWRSVVRAARVPFAVLGLLAVLLVVRLGDHTYSAGEHTDSPSAVAGQPGTAPQNPAGPGPGPGPGETLLTGTTAEKVKAAAQAAVPGGTIIRVETDSAGSPYEAHVRKSDGTEVRLKIDSIFRVTSIESGPPGGPPGGP
jgi:hypothetical protein